MSTVSPSVRKDSDLGAIFVEIHSQILHCSNSWLLTYLVRSKMKNMICPGMIYHCAVRNAEVSLVFSMTRFRAGKSTNGVFDYEKIGNLNSAFSRPKNGYRLYFYRHLRIQVYADSS